MKKIAFLLMLCTGLFVTDMAAQPTFYFFPEGNIEVNDGDQICVPVRTADFTDLLDIMFSVNWDPTTLQFTGVQNLNPLMTNLAMADFDISAALTNNGMLTFDWDAYQNMDCSDNPEGLTLDDDITLFELCFDVSGIYGGYSEIKITGDPLAQFVTRENANCNNIGMFTQSSCTSFSVGYTPVTFNCSSASGQMGETICVNISIEDFTNILSIQGSINWDPTIIEFESVNGFKLENFNSNNFGATLPNTMNGFVTFSWGDFINPNGTTLTDGCTIMELCYTLIGEGGDCSPFVITGVPSPIEVVDAISQNNPGGDEDLTPVVIPGEVCIDNFDPNGISLNMEDKEVCIGEQFCIDVTVEDFNEVREIYFSLGWNPNVLQFDGIQNIAINNTSYPNNFTTNQISSGKLGFGKDAPGTINYSLPDGSTLMTICFTVVGNGGSTSVVSITNDPEPIQVIQGFPATDIGINTNSSLVSVKQTQGITVIAGSGSGFPGDEICIDFEVANFDDITRTQFTMNWNGNGDVLQYSHVVFGDLPDLDNFNFLSDFVANGTLGFEWEPFDGPVTRPNGTVIFSVCFDIIGDPGECTDITFGDFPYAIDIQTASSNGINVGMNNQPGEVCVDNPVEYIIDITDVFGAPGSETCVEFSVENFIQMTQNTYSINWNFEDLEFVGINPTGNLASFGIGDFDISANLVDNGNLIIDWLADNVVQGESVPDGTVLFELCFNVLGDPGTCVTIDISENPEPIEVSSAPTGGANVGLTSIAGSICITDVLMVDNVIITGVDCPGDNSGTIDFLVTGGSNVYMFTWDGPGTFGVNDTLPLMNITNGTYFVTIEDSGGVTFDTTFEVGLTGNAPIADAGEDFTPACDQGDIFLDGTGSSGNGPLQYLWVGLGGCANNILPGDETSPTPQVFGNCSFELQVTEIASGCVVVDTVTVLAQSTPVPIADPDTEATCLMDTILISSQIPAGNDISIEWTAISGTIYSPIDSVNVQVSAGEYVITLTQDGSGCMGTDTVIVVDNTMAPNASGGDDDVLGCADVSITLDGSGSTGSTGEPLEYLWSTTGNGNVCSLADNPSIEACGPGEYTLLVTDTGNGCTAIDMVLVTADTLKPISNGGPDVVLNCLNEDIGVLDGSQSTMGPLITYSWVFNGGEIDNEALTTVSDPGLYSLVVMNTDNGCSATSEVMVTEDFAEPEVMISAVFGEISCNNPEDTIAISTNIPNADFSWNVIVADSIAIIDMDGTYAVTVTNTDNGCITEEAITINDNQEDPQITAGPDKFFNCSDGEVQLEGAINPAIPDAIIQWSGCLGCFVSPATDIQPIVDGEGMYVLTVQDPSNGCISTDTVMVTVDMTMPQIETATGDTLTCTETCGTLAFTLLDPNMLNDITIEWSVNGSVIMGEENTTLEVCEDGLYEVLITHNASGCTDSAPLTALEDMVAPAMADAGVDGEVDCDNPMFTLDASTSLIADETTVQWFEGAAEIGAIDEAILMVGGGTYTLVVTNIANGCTATDDITIVENGNIPTADAGLDMEKGCNDVFVTLDGSNSDPGDYEWMFNGNVVGMNSNTFDAELEGIYTLTVTDPVTGCSSSDEVMVTFNIDIDGADAMADVDQCSTEGTLLGNSPIDVTGIWDGSG